MEWVIGIVVVLAVLAITSLVIHKFFPRFKKYEPLMLTVELLSLFLMFID
jgi:hypothetical protein